MKRRPTKKTSPADVLRDAVDFANSISPLPRCPHGAALADGALERILSLGASQDTAAYRRHLLADALTTARAEGYRAGLEAGARWIETEAAGEQPLESYAEDIRSLASRPEGER